MTYLRRENLNNMVKASKIIERLKDFKNLNTDNMSEEVIALNACMQHNLYRELISLIGEAKAKAIYKKIYGVLPEEKCLS